MIRADDDETLFETEAGEFSLLVDAEGRPLEGVKIALRVDRISKAIHTQFGERDVRIYATMTTPDEEQILKVWCLVCGGSCPKRVGERCRNPLPKPGSAGQLRTDAAIALGRRLTNRERIRKDAFLGRTFIAEVSVVRTNHGNEALPPSAWYSKVGPFSELVS